MTETETEKREGGAVPEPPEAGLVAPPGLPVRGPGSGSGWGRKWWRRGGASGSGRACQWLTSGPLLAPPAVRACPMAAPVDFKIYVDQACRAAEEFANIYYETMDKRRRVLTRLYQDTATLVWNGNAVSGQEALTEFFEMLPSSEFQVTTFDCQPVHEQATLNQTTVLVVTCGTVKFDGSKQQYFSQNFLLTAQTTNNNTVWKIASDCFRFHDWPSS